MRLVTIITMAFCGLLALLNNDLNIPKVIKSYNKMNAGSCNGLTLDQIILPDNIKLIALTGIYGPVDLLRSNEKSYDSDLLFSLLFKSKTKATDMSLSAMESIIAKYTVVTNNNGLFIINVLSEMVVPRSKDFSAILVHGDGFGCRIDYSKDETLNELTFTKKINRDDVEAVEWLSMLKREYSIYETFVTPPPNTEFSEIIKIYGDDYIDYADSMRKCPSRYSFKLEPYINNAKPRLEVFLRDESIYRTWLDIFDIPSNPGGPMSDLRSIEVYRRAIKNIRMICYRYWDNLKQASWNDR